MTNKKRVIRRKKSSKKPGALYILIAIFVIAGGIFVYNRYFDKDTSGDHDKNPNEDQISTQDPINEELAHFLTGKNSKIAKAESVQIITSNNTTRALAGGVISFKAKVRGKNSEGNTVEEIYEDLDLQEANSVKKLRDNYIVILEDNDTPASVTINAAFCGYSCDFTYTVVKQNVSNKNFAILVNRYTKTLPTNFKPPSLVYTGSKAMEPEADGMLKKMIADAKKEGISMYLVSGYRAYSLQESLYNRAIKADGKDQQYSAPPGHSEHQLGFAADISCAELGGSLEEEFAETDAGKWLAKNCHKYGFVLRYTKKYVDITGYIYEPWHFRYIGIDLAELYHSEGWTTLDEFLSIPR